MKSFYPSKIMAISQNYSSGNHLAHWNNANFGDYPIDECYGDSKQTGYLLAPFDCKVVKIQDHIPYGVWLTSTSEVETPIGKCVVTFKVVHIRKTDIDNMHIGKIYKQWDKICMENKDAYSTGYHNHITAGIGNIKGSGGATNSRNCYVLTTTGGTRKPEDLFFLNPDLTIVKNNGGIKWVTATSDSGKYTTGIYKCLADMKIRSGAGTKYTQVKVKDCTAKMKPALTSKSPNAYAIIKKGTKITALEIIENSDTDIWLKNYSGYVNIINGKNTNMEKVEC